LLNPALQKAVLSQLNFKFPSVILIGQLVFTIVVLKLLKIAKLITFDTFNWHIAKKVRFTHLSPFFHTLTFPISILTLIHFQVLVVSILYSANVGIALVALSSLNIPMYSTFKRLTTAVVLAMEYFVLHKKPSLMVIGCVMVMSVGAVVAGLGDVSFDLTGYSMAIISCIVQAAYLVTVSKKEKELDLNSFGLLNYNSILSLPFVILVGFIKDEYASAWAYPNWSESYFLFNFTMACALGAFLNYSIFVCTVINSPLTLTVSGQAKSLFTMTFGFFAFGGVKITALNAIGIFLNTAGSAGYSAIKYTEKARANEPLPGDHSHKN
jgi:solute carrier family 35 protein